ncbi:hypothetical protein D3C75_807530 [compost metagenome]
MMEQFLPTQPIPARSATALSDKAPVSTIISIRAPGTRSRMKSASRYSRSASTRW